jgi:hypothetical protein
MRERLLADDSAAGWPHPSGYSLATATVDSPFPFCSHAICRARARFLVGQRGARLIERQPAVPALGYLLIRRARLPTRAQLPAGSVDEESIRQMGEWGELSFKVVRLEQAGQEVLARAGNILVARAAYDVAVSLWGTEEIELRQGSRVICSSKKN